jgi:hypothetical protein
MTVAAARRTPDRCIRCAGTEHLIRGDGPIACRPCIDLLGGIAGDPERADNRILTALLRRHGDAIRLNRTPEVRGKASAPLRWEWIAPWPEAERLP